MIEGNFRDVSLPGLLQFLCAELGKSYRIRVSSAKHAGEVFIYKGVVTAASFGLLEGEDALCEFIGWHEGTFGVELLNEQIEVRRNLQLPVTPNEALADQVAFLREKQIGLNSLIVASKEFGTPDWQEGLKNHPLYREDFLVVTWIREGRTMRQAMREFNLDIWKAIGMLFRLTVSKSILIRRPGGMGEQEPGAEPVRIINPGSIERFLTTGGQEAASAAVVKQISRTYTADASGMMAQDTFVSTAFLGNDQIRRQVINDNHPAIDLDPTNMRPSVATRLRARSVRSVQKALAANEGKRKEATSASPSPSSVTLPPVPLRELLLAQAANREEAEAALAAINDLTEANPRKASADAVEIPPKPINPASASAWQKSSTTVPAENIPPNIDSIQSANKPSDTVTSLPAQPAPAPETSSSSQANAFASLVDEPLPQLSQQERATTRSLPLVAFDIERLLRKTFTQTQFGRLALTNPSLDPNRRHTLVEVGLGKTLTDLVAEDTRTPSAVLASFRYCLDRGYIESDDSVIPLTADLLLGRMEVDQYLLQRRRITGDELRDLSSNARGQGMRLIDLLFREHYLTVSDVETLIREQKRFGLK